LERDVKEDRRKTMTNQYGLENNNKIMIKEKRKKKVYGNSHSINKEHSAIVPTQKQIDEILNNYGFKDFNDKSFVKYLTTKKFIELLKGSIKLSWKKAQEELMNKMKEINFYWECNCDTCMKFKKELGEK
jgi:hypothetical protein